MDEHDQKILGSQTFELGGYLAGVSDTGISLQQIVGQRDNELSDFVSQLSGSSEPTKDEFMQIVQAYDGLREWANTLYEGSDAYLSQRSDDPRAQEFHSIAQAKRNEILGALAAFDFWLRALPEATARGYITGAGDFQYPLTRILDLKSHSMPTAAEEETLIKEHTSKRAGLSAEIDALEGKLRFDVLGKEHSISTVFGSLVSDPSPELRKAGYTSVLEALAVHRDKIFEAYRGVVKSWYEENIIARRFPRPISPKNFKNGLLDETVDMVMGVVKNNFELWQSFFRIKARLLGSDVLRREDIYAPTVSKNQKIGLPESHELVMKLMSELDPRVGDWVYEAFKRKRVDAGTDPVARPGKLSGAFCTFPGPNQWPLVFYNFNGSLGEVSTIAHEFGHMVHARLASNRSYLASEPGPAVAEIASTFVEGYVLDRTLETTEDPDIRFSLRFSKISNLWATIARQVGFASFEIGAHDAIVQGAGIEEVNQIYFRTLEEQFGDAVLVPKVFENEWLYVSHFWHYPFYVYSYALAQLVGSLMYVKFKQDGKSALPDWLHVLELGNSKSPAEALASAGIDIRDPRTFETALDLISDEVSELERAI